MPHRKPERREEKERYRLLTGSSPEAEDADRRAAADGAREPAPGEADRLAEDHARDRRASSVDE